MGPKKKKGGKKKKASSKSNDENKDVNLPLPPVPRPVLQTPHNQTFMYSVATAEVKSVARMVQHYNFGDALVSTDANGATALHHAAGKGDLEMCKLLLSYQAVPVDKKENTSAGGYTALHLACIGGHDRIIRMLCDAGANVNEKANSSLGETPLHICCKNGEKRCAKVLLSSGAKPDASDAFGHNASFWAQKHNPEMIKELDLPLARTATPAEFLLLMQARNPMGFKVPTAAKKKKGGKKGGKKKKK
jgi:ankyrin repeat protein